MDAHLPLIFAALMGLAVLLYVILDGYDLGVGLLFPFADDPERDRMIASIGPFWDANETWLVLGVGILLIAFPAAHGVIMTSLYLPICLMLCGLILRGVAFDFRYKVRAAHKAAWDRAFFFGSLTASLAQGFMLGVYINGFDTSPGALAFAALASICTAAGYGLLGASWLQMKALEPLARRAAKWGRVCLVLTAIGVLAVSIATPLLSPRIFARWFDFPNVVWLAPVPILTAAAIVVAWQGFDAPRAAPWWAFAGSVGIFILSFAGLAYSLFPYVVPERLTIWDAAAATSSLRFVFYGVAVTVPAIMAYSAYAYYVFWGEHSELSYD